MVVERDANVGLPEAVDGLLHVAHHTRLDPIHFAARRSPCSVAWAPKPGQKTQVAGLVFWNHR